MAEPCPIESFIARWQQAPVTERSHHQSFIAQLCEVIGVPAPDRERAGDLDYCFERPVRFLHDDGSTNPGFIDCYRRGAFVLEAKQSGKRMRGGDLDPGPQLALFGNGSAPARARATEALDRLMRIAKRQAENYAKALDEWPPFLVIVDVGRGIELWSDFARQGKSYVPFPDRAGHRIALDDLRSPAVRERLRRVWTEPLSLDPSAHATAVTTDIAEGLARLTASIARRSPASDPVGHAAWTGRVAVFVTQCIFAMFADSVGLIEQRGFRRFLETYRGQAEHFHKGAADFFRRMEAGSHCPAIQQDLQRFNGGFLGEAAAVPITEAELDMLLEAARRDWASVEPAIFGTLLERALEPAERSRLGAHYTPRAYVETLVEPTVMEPLRSDWQAAEVAAIGAFLNGRPERARDIVRTFHRTLCDVIVLDPACGTGNFLYVAMEMMKALESEVLVTLAELGDDQPALELDGHTVSPRQFHGIEINRRAASIAELVMWIGYLQWHFRTFGDAKPTEPILRNYNRIECRDALLTHDGTDAVRDPDGRPAVDGEDRIIERYRNPRPAAWPQADFIIGNPPFIAGKDLRRELGQGYVDAIWHIRQGRSRSADHVMAWWDRAAETLTRPDSRLRRFGFITTNSITQTFSRRVMERHLTARPGLSLVFAVPDHPWIRGAATAQVRIAMTVAQAGEADGQARCLRVEAETGDAVTFAEGRGIIAADLTLGPDVTSAVPLQANRDLCSPGMKLHGAGFLVTADQALALAPGPDNPIQPYRNGRDLAETSRDLRVIDLTDLSEAEARRRYPALVQHLLETVKIDRDRNNRTAYRDAWWMFGEPRRELRAALRGLPRYIVTIETSKHRWFGFLDRAIVPDNKLIVVASDDPYVLGVLSSRVHRLWYAANAGRIGVYDQDAVYVKSRCFDPFPFPDAYGAQRAEIAALGEELDAQRRRVLDDEPGLTMTGLYNAVDRLASGLPLEAAERDRSHRARANLIAHLHQRLDGVVQAAYGLAGMHDEAVVQALLTLNRQRAAEERDGHIRWLRPDFQAARGPVRDGPSATQIELDMARGKPVLPSDVAETARTVLDRMRQVGRPLDADTLQAMFEDGRGRRARIDQTLAILAVAGAVRQTDAGWFAPRRAA